MTTRRGETYKTRFRCSIEDDGRKARRKSRCRNGKSKSQKIDHVCHTSLAVTCVAQGENRQFWVEVRLSTPHGSVEQNPYRPTEEDVETTSKGGEVKREESIPISGGYDLEGSLSPLPDGFMSDSSEASEMAVENLVLSYPDDN